MPPAKYRFLQTDPIPGGSANAYDYCNQDPINGYDLGGTRPMGLDTTRSPYYKSAKHGWFSGLRNIGEDLHKRRSLRQPSLGWAPARRSLEGCVSPRRPSSAPGLGSLTTACLAVDIRPRATRWRLQRGDLSVP